MSISRGGEFLEELTKSIRDQQTVQEGGQAYFATPDYHRKLLLQLLKKTTLEDISAFLAFTESACLQKLSKEAIETYLASQEDTLKNFSQTLVHALELQRSIRNGIVRKANQEAALLRYAITKEISSEQIKIEGETKQEIKLTFADEDTAFFDAKKALDDATIPNDIDKIRNMELALYRNNYSEFVKQGVRNTTNAKFIQQSQAQIIVSAPERHATQQDSLDALNTIDQQIDRLIKDPRYQLTNKQFNCLQGNQIFPQSASDYAFIKLGKLLDIRRQISTLAAANRLSHSNLIRLLTETEKAMVSTGKGFLGKLRRGGSGGFFTPVTSKKAIHDLIKRIHAHEQKRKLNTRG